MINIIKRYNIYIMQENLIGAVLKLHSFENFFLQQEALGDFVTTENCILKRLILD